MKSENYTVSVLFLVGFFGIFLLMRFQPVIAGEKAREISVSEEVINSEVVFALPDTVAWRNY